mmetsp:Transcript_23216/g.32807  ORF Transcript_23216/g.32807 Transcript_23216/m.32807 type:complete len:188 (+) Transcript_23216:51-614(+)
MVNPRVPPNQLSGRGRWARLKLPKKKRMLMLRNMATSLIKHERIETTMAKAMSITRVVDRLVTKAKTGGQHQYREVRSFVREKQMVDKLFDVVAPRYEGRPGGYTRVVKSRRRFGDAAPMAYVEFVDRQGELRLSKQITEDDIARRKAQEEEAMAHWKSFQEKQKAKMAVWKVAFAKNPYLKELKGK